MKSVFGIAFFVASIFAAQWAVEAVGLPVPASVAAMVMIAVGLAVLGKVPSAIEEGAAVLFRIFPLLFIPAIVGVVTVLDLVTNNWLLLIFAITGSSLLGLLVTALLYRALRAKKRSSL